MLGKFHGCTFNDVFIRPLKTSCAPFEVTLDSEVVACHQSKLPVISSPMTTVYSPDLAKVLASYGVLCPEPREDTKSTSSESKLAPINANTTVPRCITVSPFDEVSLSRAFECQDVSYVFVDTVHAHNTRVLDTISALPTSYRHRMILGNIVTREAAHDVLPLELAGVRVGMGSGSICTTTEITGVGVPILQAIEEVSSILAGTRTKVIADGGIRNTGDMAKALAAGANCVMLGKLFAATTEAGFKAEEINGVLYKRYQGSFYSSVELSESKDRDIRNAVKELSGLKPHRSEGISGYIKQTGSAKLLLEQIHKSLSASLAFVGALSLEEFHQRVVVDRVSRKSAVFGRPHGIDIVTDKDRLVVT